jgi:hypothetical protein
MGLLVRETFVEALVLEILQPFLVHGSPPARRFGPAHLQ